MLNDSLEKTNDVVKDTTGVIVNNKLDDGKIIIQKKFTIGDKDDEISLKRKTQRLEYKAFPEAIIKIFRNI